LAGKQGYSAEELMTFRPGLIYTSLKFNTPTGPWADWMGFDFNAGALTGLFTETGTPDQPGFPHAVNVVVDFLAGYLATLGTQAALLRRATEGGSYKVTVTLTQATMFEMSLGLVDKKMLIDLESLGEEHQPLKPNLVTGQTAYGEFTRLGSQVEMSKTPEFWADPIINPIGSAKAEWLPR
jgi:crotonobetainyl-CoA:carnitine CoA-transferase CaiB-like acyl-CoA transferase